MMIGLIGKMMILDGIVIPSLLRLLRSLGLKKKLPGLLEKLLGQRVRVRLRMLVQVSPDGRWEILEIITKANG